MAIVTSVKCIRPSVARAVFIRVTLPPCRARYTRRFVSKLVEKSRIACERVVSGGQSSVTSVSSAPVKEGGMKISPVGAVSMKISTDCVAQAQ